MKSKDACAAVRADITKRFSDCETTFTVFDFQRIAKKYNSPLKHITGLLIRMKQSGALEIVGEQKNPHGGGMTKIYIVSDPEKVPARSGKEMAMIYAQRKLDKANMMERCANRLNSVLDKMTSARA